MDFPLVNACLNGSAAVLLVVGYWYIRAGKEEAHATLMRLAFLVSAVFLANYLYYHVKVLPLQGGPTPYNETGVKKGLYLFLLITHVVLAAINLPMVLRVLWLAHKQDWPRHKRWARWTFPIWLYVSVTGVLVYLVLYQWNPLPAIQ
jgi:putative membrane protein